jgi:hypothetical protein
MPPIPHAQVARSNSAAALADLAKVIRAEHSTVVSAISSAVRHALAAGRALIEAKNLVAHGGWRQFLRDCDLGHRQAERYAQLARLYDANPSSGTDSDLVGLSIQAAIKKLSPPKPLGGTRERRSSPTLAAQEKLNSLDWADASPAELARFVGAVGWQPLMENMPPDWLSDVQQWLRARLLKEPAVTIDQNGNVLSDDLSIPSFLRRARTLAEQEE